MLLRGLKKIRAKIKSYHVIFYTLLNSESIKLEHYEDFEKVISDKIEKFLAQ